MEKIMELLKKPIYLAAGGAVVLVLVGIIVLVSMGGDDGSDSDLVVDFSDPSFGVDPLISVEEQVAQTVAAMVPTEVPEPTADVGATVAASMAATRVAMPAVALDNRLSPQAGLRPYLTEYEVRYMSEAGDAIWASTALWLHMRQVVFRDLGYWTDGGVDIHMALASTELQILESRWERLSDDVDDNESLSDEVREYIGQLEDGVRALRSAYRQLETTRALLKSVDGTLEVSEREAVAQAKAEIAINMDRFVSVMGRYGCAICGELIRDSGG